MDFYFTFVQCCNRIHRSRRNNSKKYEDEFKEEFKTVEPDAETASFNDEQQKKVYDFLSYVEMAIETISNRSEIITNLKKDIADFKSEIPSLTKKKVVERGSKLYGIFKKLDPLVRAENIR